MSRRVDLVPRAKMSRRVDLAARADKSRQVDASKRVHLSDSSTRLDGSTWLPVPEPIHLDGWTWLPENTSLDVLTWLPSRQVFNRSRQVYNWRQV